MTTITYTWGVVQLECYPEVANLTDVVFIEGGALKYRGSAGTVTTIAAA